MLKLNYLGMTGSDRRARMETAYVMTQERMDEERERIY